MSMKAHIRSCPAKAADEWLIPAIIGGVSTLVFTILGAIFLRSFWEDMFQFFDDHIFR